MKQSCIAVVGDFSFHGRSDESECERALAVVKASWIDCALSFGNLEGPLAEGGEAVQGKCSLKSVLVSAKVMYNAGLRLVSLANNHVMDYEEEGLLSTIRILDESGIFYVGAGRDETSALAPLFLKMEGKKYAFLARSSVVVSSPCYASGQSPGVAQFDLEETKQAIEDCKKQADITAVVIHWGIEHYSYPTPKQRREARELIDAGSDLIIGHHPHVLQGVERIGNGLVCYSLGNFLFDDIEWAFVDKEEQIQEKVVKLTEENRKGGVLRITLSAEGVISYEFIPTYIEHDGTVKIEKTLERQREFSRLCSRLHWPAYSFFWRLYSLRQEWKLRVKPMTIGKLKWANLKKLRPKHFRELYDRIRRSGKITSEKSTNPYE